MVLKIESDTESTTQDITMLKLALCLSVLVALCAAYPAPWGYPYNGGFPYRAGFPYGGGFPYAPFWGWGSPFSLHGSAFPHTAYGKLTFYGTFPGSCLDKPDGLYYVDERSFAYCFSGQKSVQPCAEGSANPPLAYFSHGGHYGFQEFCSINLVAQGYTNNLHGDNKKQVNAEAPYPGYQGYQETAYLGDEYKSEGYNVQRPNQLEGQPK